MDTLRRFTRTVNLSCPDFSHHVDLERFLFRCAQNSPLPLWERDKGGRTHMGLYRTKQKTL